MKTKMKPAVYASLIAVLFLIIAFVACSKSSDNGYGNNGGSSSGSSVSIKYMAFSTATLTITSGTTVTWTNNDGVAHTVTADDASFDSGNIAPGAKFTHKFTTAGTVAYHCEIHPMMKASVKVN